MTFFCPQETSAKLRCPERGFYSILRFMAEDNPVIPAGFPRNPDDTLILVEINLSNYSDSELSESALNGINELFCILRNTGCGLIIRFLYDWCGKNIISEPKSIDIILGHIKQLGSLIRDNSDVVFLLQGLFVGNWGEMHGSRFVRADYLKKLNSALLSATENRVMTAVRTPALWRAVTGISFTAEANYDSSLPGLFNDGMLGNDSEYGTFSEKPSEREQELMLQEKISRFVPYGGEVVGTAPQSDAQCAINSLDSMRVTYLNRYYDEKTLAKWKKTALTDENIWKGMSYFDYAEKHLGYRFVIRSVNLRLSPLSGVLSAKIRIENIGFAPIYHSTSAELVFIRDSIEITFPMEGNVNNLLKSMGARCLTVKISSLKEKLDGSTYEIYFRLKSLKYNITIPTANQGSSETGCLIGRYTD